MLTSRMSDQRSFLAIDEVDTEMRGGLGVFERRWSNGKEEGRHVKVKEVHKLDMFGFLEQTRRLYKTCPPGLCGAPEGGS